MWSLIISTIFILITTITGGALLLCVCFLVVYNILVERSNGVCKCQTKLHGKVALVTGGNAGIGFETAKDLARRGARVVIASRNNKKSEEAVAVIKELTGNNKVEYRHLDLEKLDSVRKFACKFNDDFDQLHILVNNAGCGVFKGGITEYGTDSMMQINYVGPFLLTRLLLDKLIKSKPSRIVVVSSTCIIFPFKFDPEEIANPLPKNIGFRYGCTKLCNVLWTKELAKRLPSGVTANALHPGLVWTDIYKDVPLVLKYLLYFIALFLLFKNTEESAQTSIHLCVSQELENSTGNFYNNCKEMKLTKRVEDSDLAKRLWHETMKVVKQ